MRLLVLLLPLLEIAGLVLAGRWVGVLGVLLLVVLAALVGGLMLRREGREAPDAVRRALRRGASPAPLLLRGGVRLVAALLLIAPGFLSDAAALLLLLPPVQRALARTLARRGIAAGLAGGLAAAPTGGLGSASAPPAGPVVDAEWEDVPPAAGPEAPGNSGWTRP